MQRLNKQLLFPNNINENLPERIIQFGEGNFLRGFIDWMVHELNQKGLFHGRVAAVQPTPNGRIVPKLNEQDGLYTMVLRGKVNGEVIDQTQTITSVSRGINPYKNWNEVLKLAENEEIQFVFSNTTEAGLTYTKEVFQPEESPLSFPGKVTAFLYHRYRFFEGSPDSGLALIPCELVENNGSVLKELILKISCDWRLPDSFLEWTDKHNHFCNTLVDRIVTGYPKEDIEMFEDRLGYEDKLLTVGEPYHLFAIEADNKTISTIPFHQAGLNVHWGDVKPFRELKVRILNGAHTMMFAVAYLSGKNTVLEAMEDPLLRRYIDKGIDQEILPVIDMKELEKRAFADSVVERFLNPFNQHALTSLGLNAISKYRTRVLPTLLGWGKCKQRLPNVLTFSLSALIVYYRPIRTGEGRMTGKRGDQEYIVRDQPETIEFFNHVWETYDGTNQAIRTLVNNVLGNEQLWGSDLTKVEHLSDQVSIGLSSIVNLGMKKAVDQFL